MTLSETQVAAPPSGATPAEPLGPESLTWKMGLPRTALLLAGRALFLQTMHPVVGAGVRDFSTFRTDPWGRLDRTLESLQIQMFGGARSIDEAQRLRELHKKIRGIGFDGERYRALNPEAYAWVHLSNFDTALCFDRWFIRAHDRPAQERLYAEWRRVGRVLGIREEHLPADIAGLRAYVDDVVEHTLRDNEMARELLQSLRLDDVSAPPLPYVPEPLWKVLRPLSRQLLHDTTVGTLPSGLRQKLGLAWSSIDRRRLQGIALAVRAASLPVPDRLMQYPLAYRAQCAHRAVRVSTP
ncbi:MAG TPA: oxygenase MpaB family protein [Acidimicrobiales bacterium]|jgi:uncharacterized protein (DUF2236 family)